MRPALEVGERGALPGAVARGCHHRPVAGWEDDGDGDRAPICPACGVTALPREGAVLDTTFVCENPDCEAFGDEV